MGTGVGLTLRAKGHQVSCWNRTKANAKELLDAGATWAATPPPGGRRGRLRRQPGLERGRAPGSAGWAGRPLRRRPGRPDLPRHEHPAPRHRGAAGGRVRPPRRRLPGRAGARHPRRIPLRRPLDHGRRRPGGLRPGAPALQADLRDRPLHGRHRQGLRRQALRQPPGLGHPGLHGRVAGHGVQGGARRPRAAEALGRVGLPLPHPGRAPAARCSATTSRSPSTCEPW